MSKLISLRLPKSIYEQLSQEKDIGHCSLTKIIIDKLNSQIRFEDMYKQITDIKAAQDQFKNQISDQAQLLENQNKKIYSQIIKTKKDLANLKTLVDQLLKYDDEYDSEDKDAQGVANWFKGFLKK